VELKRQTYRMRYPQILL